MSRTERRTDAALFRRISAQDALPFAGEEEPSPAEQAAQRCWRSELTERQRRYFLYYYRDCMTMRAIAAHCGVNVSTVSRTLRRARLRLRRILRYYYDES